jgi:hypothetical protein
MSWPRSRPAIEQVPFEVVGLDFDNGTEFLNKAVGSPR